MPLRLIFTFLFIAFSLLCRGQQQGCFYQDADSGLTLQANIDTGKYSTFFVGELHGVAITPALRLALIKYLNRNFGVTDVFMEVGYSAAYLFNSYLATGDTAFITRPSLPYTFKAEDVAFWQALYAYNGSLKHKITIYGTDFERIEWLKVLKMLRPAETPKPKEIADVLTYIDATHLQQPGWLKSVRQKEQDSVYKLVRASIEKYLPLYAAFYGDDFMLVKQIMLNENRYSNFTARNNAMYHNILAQVRQDSLKKFVVFAGVAHANRADERCVCGQLYRNMDYHKKLAVMAMTCKDCYDWQQPETGKALYRGAYTYSKDSLLMNDLYKQQPAAGCRYQLLNTSDQPYPKVSLYSDFVITINGQ